MYGLKPKRLWAQYMNVDIAQNQVRLTHYEKFVSNADFRYSCPPVSESHGVIGSPFL